MEPVLENGQAQVFFQVRMICNTCGFNDQNIGFDRLGDLIQGFYEIGFHTYTEYGALADFKDIKFI